MRACACVGNLYSPVDWELRVDAVGTPLYYDHQNKEVRLDLPSPQLDTQPPFDSRIRDFLARYG